MYYFNLKIIQGHINDILNKNLIIEIIFRNLLHFKTTLLYFFSIKY